MDFKTCLLSGWSCFEVDVCKSGGGVCAGRANGVARANNSVPEEGSVKDGSLKNRAALDQEFPMLYQSLQLFIGPMSTFHFTPFHGTLSAENKRVTPLGYGYMNSGL
ncbi:unnamed protein product [Colias eurytheme]|nr:unnamed protein product [Colias eurytheme]